MLNRRSLLISAGALGACHLLQCPAEAGVGAFFLKMLQTIAKTFPPILFSRYLQHSQWRQPLEDVYSQLLTYYSPHRNAQTTGPTHQNLIAQSAFHLTSSALADANDTRAYLAPGSATFLNAVAGKPNVASISGLNYSALDQAGQLYTDQYGCDCAAGYMLPTGAPEARRVVAYDNGYVGSSIVYPSGRGNVEVTQSPYEAFQLLPNGSRQYDVAHVVKVTDEGGRTLWETGRQKALAYRQNVA